MSTLHLTSLRPDTEPAVTGIAAAPVLVCRVAGARPDCGLDDAGRSGLLSAAPPTRGHG